MKVKYKDEFIEIDLIVSKLKTNIYSVYSLCSEINLGIIKWHPSWRHYCFFPTEMESVVFSDRCLINIGNFITKINQEHKSNQPYNHKLNRR